MRAVAALLFAALAACTAFPAGSVKIVTLRETGALADGSPSRVAGRAELQPYLDGGARLVVALEGLPPGATHAGHVHAGPCSKPGPVVVPLADATADTAGKAVSDNRFAAALLPPGGSVNFHQRATGHPSGVGPNVTCGDLGG